MFYEIRLPQIAHETIDGETFIINTENGIYFVANGYASIIWNAIATGYSLSQITHAFAAEHIFDTNEQVIEKFISLLLDEGLVVEGNIDASESNSSPLHVVKNTNFQLPVLARHEDLQELVMLDPIHEVNESMGWPFRDKAVV
jgi:hypothetical protein